MKRIELVITPWALNAFKASAARLDIPEFDLIQVYRSVRPGVKRRSRFYRGGEFTSDMLPRLRVEFVLFDEALDGTLRTLRESVSPDSITIFSLDHDLRSFSVEHGRLSTNPSITTHALDQGCDNSTSEASDPLDGKGNNDQDTDNLPRSDAALNQHRSGRF
jgi:hypothetical protein